MVFSQHNRFPVRLAIVALDKVATKEEMEVIQLLNTAIVKTKERGIDDSYEERLKQVCDSPVMKHLSKTITGLAEDQGVSRDQAAQMIVETIRELDSIWSDYVTMEGIDRLKALLKGD